MSFEYDDLNRRTAMVELGVTPGPRTSPGSTLLLVPHGPDADAFDKASANDLVPQKLDNTLAFMFESRYRFVPTEFAINGGALDQDYAACWGGLEDRFTP